MHDKHFKVHIFTSSHLSHEYVCALRSREREWESLSGGKWLYWTLFWTENSIGQNPIERHGKSDNHRHNQCNHQPRSDFDRKRAYYLHTTQAKNSYSHCRPAHQWARKIFHSWKSCDSCVETRMVFVIVGRCYCSYFYWWCCSVLLFRVCECESVLWCVIPLVVVVVTASFLSVLIALEEFRVFSTVNFFSSLKDKLTRLVRVCVCVSLYPECLCWHKFLVFSTTCMCAVYWLMAIVCIQHEKHQKKHKRKQ